MRALTILQPWADLIMSGAKRVENRTWPTKYRGRMYVHAGKSREALVTKTVDGVEVCIHTGKRVEDMRFGYVLGVVVVLDCIPIEELRGNSVPSKYPELQAHQYAEGPFCWVLAENPVHIGPWPYKGAQGLFDINSLTLDRIANRQLGIEPENSRHYRIGCEP
jgi:activating signal cointegrator 1